MGPVRGDDEDVLGRRGCAGPRKRGGIRTLALRMDEQIARVYGDPAWAADNYGPQLDEMAASGDELGLHPHAWS